MEMEMEMAEKPSSWKVVNRRMKKKKNQQLRMRRPWDALPSLALSNIFIKLDFKDRCCSIPFVCKTWNSVISGDPLCWSSMIPESSFVSPDDAFIKNPADYYSLQVYPPSSYKKIYDYSHLREDYYPLVIRGGKWDGVSRFRTLLKKTTSSSSSPSSSSRSRSSTITSLYLTPFTYSYPDNEDSLDKDEILRLIANCCPNLKHISFDGFRHASKGAVFEVFHKCKKLELIDFSESLGYPPADSLIEVIQELGNNLPRLRGIRILTAIQSSTLDAIATHLPRIKLLDIMCDASVVPGLLLSSETQLPELQYLRVGVYFLAAYLPPPVGTTHISEFHYEEIDYLLEPYADYCQCIPRHHRRPGSSHSLLCNFCKENAEHEKEAKEEEDLLSELSSPPDPQDYSVLKQKKEDEYYLSILKENKKKTRNHHGHRHALMRRRGLMKKKNNKASSLIIMKKKKKNRDNRMYGYYAEDYMYLVH